MSRPRLTQPNLDARLSLLASLVRTGARCADIGTDHGLLIAWLAASGHIPSGFACDINQKPLEKAAFSLRAYGVEKQVTLILSDGLSAFSSGMCDDIVIAGMGGQQIWRIIDAAEWTRDPALRFILQPMTRPEILRRKLYANGFVLLEEHPVVSGRFIYSVMHVAYTGECRQISRALAYGGLLWQDTGVQSPRYFARIYRILASKLQCLRLQVPAPPCLDEYEQLLNQTAQKAELSAIKEDHPQ